MKNVGGGVSGISRDVLRDVCYVAGDRLLDVINTSLSSGIFPENWKESTVIPVPKISKTVSCNEFRPINTLEVYEKVLELAVKKQIQKHCDANDIIMVSQYGFREHHSCETTVVNICDIFRDLCCQYSWISGEHLKQLIGRCCFKSLKVWA